MLRITLFNNYCLVLKQNTNRINYCIITLTTFQQKIKKSTTKKEQSRSFLPFVNFLLSYVFSKLFCFLSLAQVF